MTKKSNKSSPRTILKLPDLEHSKSAVLSSLSFTGSYDHAIRGFDDWYCSEPRSSFNRIVVTRYRIALELRRYAPGLGSNLARLHHSSPR